MALCYVHVTVVEVPSFDITFNDDFDTANSNIDRFQMAQPKFQTLVQVILFLFSFSAWMEFLQRQTSK